MVENGGWGSDWAAPIATLMIEKYLNDTIARKDLEKKMFEGVINPKVYQPKTPVVKRDSVVKLIPVRPKLLKTKSRWEETTEAFYRTLIGYW